MQEDHRLGGLSGARGGRGREGREDFPRRGKGGLHWHPDNNDDNDDDGDFSPDHVDRRGAEGDEVIHRRDPVGGGARPEAERGWADSASPSHYPVNPTPVAGGGEGAAGPVGHLHSVGRRRRGKVICPGAPGAIGAGKPRCQLGRPVAPWGHRFVEGQGRRGGGRRARGGGGEGGAAG